MHPYAALKILASGHATENKRIPIDVTKIDIKNCRFGDKSTVPSLTL